MTLENSTDQKNIDNQAKKTLKDFIKSFLMPTIVGKTLVLYFGINYSIYPDEGYGYGLAASIAFTALGLLMLVWKYRNHEEL
jgi:hypothetical protein